MICDLSLLHETDIRIALRNVRSQGQSGKHFLALSFSGFDHVGVFTQPEPEADIGRRLADELDVVG